MSNVGENFKKASASSLKQASEVIRQISHPVDYADTLVGAEYASATLTGVAAALETGAYALEGDISGAVKKLTAGVLETLVTLVPFAEYGRPVGLDVRKYARSVGEWIGSKIYRGDKTESSPSVNTLIPTAP